MPKVDLNKIKAEIDVRKKERGIATEQTQGAKLLPKDQFLNELMVSLKSGQDTQATNLIKLVENKTAERHGEVKRHNIDTMTIPVAPQPTNEPVGMSPERDEQLFADLEKRRKQTLAESIQGYISTPPVGAPMNNTPPQTPGAPVLNEGYLIENVKKVVNNYLTENLGPIFEEAIKSTIIEMYAVERIKEVLTENKDMIKGVVIETIKEIQARTKKGQ